MTQAQLARRIGVRTETVRNWEQDLSEPRANKLQMLSGLLNVSLTWLLVAEGDGLDAPHDPEAPEDVDLSGILTDLRDAKTELTARSQKVGRLEKRLRLILESRAS
jgi:transcriptional regulator with XRE-family HTH domain